LSRLRVRRRAAVSAGVVSCAAIAATVPALANPASDAASPKPASTTQTQSTAGARTKPPKAQARLRVHHVRRHVLAGRKLLVKGRLHPRQAGRTVALRVKRGGRWVTVARARTAKGGRYRLSWRAARPGSHRLRVTFTGTATLKPARRAIGRANVYRRALASWYGPGLYGGALACGGRLTPGTLGVASKTLPCGTKVTLRYRGRTVRVPVVDRGPYVGGREYDLTAATKQRLGFGGVGAVLSTH